MVFGGDAGDELVVVIHFLFSLFECQFISSFYWLQISARYLNQLEKKTT